MKKQLLFIVMMMVSLAANANGTEIDGIYYWLSPDTQTASVTYPGNTESDSRNYRGDIVIPPTVTYDGIDYTVIGISWGAFHHAYNMTSITIPNTIKNIASAFYCDKLTSVHITDLEAWCGIEFSGSASNPLINAHHLYLNDEEIKDLVIPNSVKSIEKYAFYCCEGLTSISLGNSVKTIGDEAFCGCTGLTSISFGNSVTTIEGGVFFGCTSLSAVTISNSVTSIGRSAFYGCSNLASITISNSVTSIGSSAFEDTAWYNNQPDGVVYAGKNVYKYKGVMPENSSIVITDGTYSITEGAFMQCANLTSITIPNSVATIGGSAFMKCTGLTSITIPSSVTTIGDNAFWNCSSLASMTFLCETIDNWFNNYSIPSLEDIQFGEGVKTIKENAFRYFTNVKTIDIGSTVTSIETRAFSGTDKLTDVTCRATSVPETDRTAFENSYPNYATLHVPAESVSHYKSHEVWSKFKDVVPLNGEETDIERLTMTNCTDYVPIIHNLSGQRITNLKKGLNVIRIKDGTIRKAVVK